MNTHFSTLSMPLEAAPRASFGAALKSLLSGWFSPQAPAPLPRLVQASRLRAQAYALRGSDHRMAAEMMAAADRHER